MVLYLNFEPVVKLLIDFQNYKNEECMIHYGENKQKYFVIYFRFRTR